MRSTPPPSQSGSAQTTPSPKGNPPPLQYPTHPSPHSNNSTPHLRDNQVNREPPREQPTLTMVPNPAHMHNAHPQNPPPHINPPHGMHPAQMGAPPSMNVQPQPHSMPNHGRQHVHTPPHAYSNVPPPQQQIPRQQGMPQNVPHNVPKPQMNGEPKPMPQRPPRNVYPSPNMAQQQYVEAPPQPQQKPEAVNCIPRHRDEVVKVIFF